MIRDAIEAALDEVKGKAPVLIGCGEPGTQRMSEVKIAGKTKAEGVLVAVPSVGSEIPASDQPTFRGLFFIRILRLPAFRIFDTSLHKG